jgi:hypothetical protein
MGGIERGGSGEVVGGERSCRRRKWVRWEGGSDFVSVGGLEFCSALQWLIPRIKEEATHKTKSGSIYIELELMCRDFRGELFSPPNQLPSL